MWTMWGSYQYLAEPSQTVHQGCFRHRQKREFPRVPFFCNGKTALLPTGFGSTTCLISLYQPPHPPFGRWRQSTLQCWWAPVAVGKWHVPACPATQCYLLLSLDVARHSFVCITEKAWVSSAWHFLWSPFGTVDCTSRSRYSWNGICLEKNTQLL